MFLILIFSSLIIVFFPVISAPYQENANGAAKDITWDTGHYFMYGPKGSSTYFGWETATCDMDDDGLSDFLVTAKEAVSGKGVVYIFWGHSRSQWYDPSAGSFSVDPSDTPVNSTIVTRIRGAQNSGELGYSIDCSGDIDGDGFTDLLMSAVDENFGGDDTGSVYILYGHNSTWSDVHISTSNSSVVSKIYGNIVDSYMGQRVAILGDINDDGYDDFGWTSYSRNYPPWAPTTPVGVFYFMFGGPRLTLDGIDIHPDNLTNSIGFIFNCTKYAFTADDIAGIGDFDGDGIDDCAFGSKNYDGSGEKYGDADIGISFVLYGKPSSYTWKTVYNITDFDGEFGTSYIGSYGWRSGAGITNIGDFNGDGMNDFAIGAVEANGIGTTDAGHVWILYGTPDFRALNISVIYFSDLNSTYAYNIIGYYAYDNLGYLIDGQGDFNGDGYDDVILGATNTDTHGLSDQGSLFVVFGGPNLPDRVKFRTDPRDGFVRFDFFFPSDVASIRFSSFVGDLDGDGMDDIASGLRYLNSRGLVNSGAVVIIPGQPTCAAGSYWNNSNCPVCPLPNETTTWNPLPNTATNCTSVPAPTCEPNQYLFSDNNNLICTDCPQLLGPIPIGEYNPPGIPDISQQFNCTFMLWNESKAICNPQFHLVDVPSPFHPFPIETACDLCPDATKVTNYEPSLNYNCSDFLCPEPNTIVRFDPDTNIPECVQDPTYYVIGTVGACFIGLGAIFTKRYRAIYHSKAAVTTGGGLFQSMAGTHTRTLTKGNKLSNSWINVLSFDGGGARTIVIVDILKELKARLGDSPRKFFHLIGGTDFGGLIALSLHSEQSLDSIDTLLTTISTTIFKSKLNKLHLMMKLAGIRLYSSNSLERLFEDTFKNSSLCQHADDVLDLIQQPESDFLSSRPGSFKSGGDSAINDEDYEGTENFDFEDDSEEPTTENDPEITQDSINSKFGSLMSSTTDIELRPSSHARRRSRSSSFHGQMEQFTTIFPIVATVASDHSPLSDGSEFVLRSYPLKDDSESLCGNTPQDDWKTWQAARAICAIPTFFKEYHHLNSDYLIGASLYHTNPSRVLHREATTLWPNCNFGTFISLGSGKVVATASVARKGNVAWVKTLANIAADPTRIHKQMSELLTPASYFRITPEFPHEIPEDASTEEEISLLHAYTKNHIRKSDAKMHLDEACAQIASTWNKLNPVINESQEFSRWLTHHQRDDIFEDASVSEVDESEMIRLNGIISKMTKENQYLRSESFVLKKQLDDLSKSVEHIRATSNATWDDV